MTLARLLQRSQAGDPAAVEAVVQTFRPDLIRLAGAILIDPAEAEEAAQDALVAALNALDDYHGRAAFKTWLFSIAINVCRRRLRKQRGRERLNRALQALYRLAGGPPADPEEALIRDETRTAVRRAVEALGEKHRLPVILFYDHELSIAEIAETLDLPPGTVLSRLHHARQKLRAVLQTELPAAAEEG